MIQYDPEKPLTNKVFIYGIKLLAGSGWAIFGAWFILRNL